MAKLSNEDRLLDKMTEDKANIKKTIDELNAETIDYDDEQEAMLRSESGCIETANEIKILIGHVGVDSGQLMGN